MICTHEFDEESGYFHAVCRSEDGKTFATADSRTLDGLRIEMDISIAFHLELCEKKGEAPALSLPCPAFV